MSEESRAERVRRQWVEYNIDAKLRRPARIIRTIRFNDAVEPSDNPPKGYSKNGKKLGRPRKC